MDGIFQRARVFSRSLARSLSHTLLCALDRFLPAGYLLPIRARRDLRTRRRRRGGPRPWQLRAVLGHNTSPRQQHHHRQDLPGENRPGPLPTRSIADKVVRRPWVMTPWRSREWRQARAARAMLTPVLSSVHDLRFFSGLWHGAGGVRERERERDSTNQVRPAWFLPAPLLRPFLDRLVHRS